MADHAFHTCSPSRWRLGPAPTGASPALAGHAHSLAAAGTTLGFAEAQLHAAELAAFQKLLGEFPGVAAAIEQSGRFPDWEAVAGDDAEAGRLLVFFLQCRRLGQVLLDSSLVPCRGVLTALGWRQLSGDECWRHPLPDDAGEARSLETDAVHLRWLEALVAREEAPPARDSPRDIRELAACSFANLRLDGGWTARLSEQGLGSRCQVGAFVLMDALSEILAKAPDRGGSSARTAVENIFRTAVATDRATAPALHAVLVAALNPPLCVSLLSGTDAVADWDCLHPGQRFERLCRAVRDLDRLGDSASPAEVDAFVDALCARCGWLTHSTQVGRATAARDALRSDPALATTRRWLAEHWAFRAGTSRRPPPATYACMRWVAFLEAFAQTGGGLRLGPAPAADLLFRCDRGLAAEAELAQAAEAAILHHAGVRVARDLLDGRPLADSAGAVLQAFPRTIAPAAAVGALAAVLRLRSVG